MARPCQPLLNPVPNGSSGSPFPAPFTSADIPIFDQNPGFGDLARQTLGDAGDPSDGWDAAVGALTSSIDEWDAAQATQDADLDTILTLLAATDTAPLETSYTNYTDSFDVGNAIVADAQGIALPLLGPLSTMWVFPGTSTPTPPSGGGSQVPGQITAGDPAFVWTLTITLFNVGHGGVSGVYLLNSSDVFTGVTLKSATAGPPTIPPGGVGTQPTWDVTVAVNVNPHAAGTFSDTLIFNADYPAFANKLPHRIALQVQQKP